MENQLPEGWNLSKVEELAQLVRGITYKKDQAKNSDTAGYKPILRANNINALLNFDSLIYVPEDLIKEEQYIKKDDIIFAMSSGSKHLVGKSARALTDYDGSYGAFCGLIRPNSEAYAPFLFYVFQENRFRQHIQQVSKGSNINNLRREHLLDYLIYYPSLDDQKSIVAKIEELFSELDNGIASLKTAQQQITIYRQSLLKHAFEGKLTEQWRKDNPDKLETPEQLLVRIQQERKTRYQQQLKDWQQAVKEWEEKGKEGKKPRRPTKLVKVNEISSSNLKGNIPSTWQLEPIGNIFSVFVGATPSRKQPDYWDGDIHWVSSGEVAFCKITSTKEKITHLGYENTSTEIHPIGTVLLAMIGEGKTRGQAAILKIPAAHNQNTAAIRVTETGFSSAYAYYFFQYQYEQTRRVGSGNNQKALNKSRVSGILFPLCPLAEQQEIVNQLEEKLSIIDQNEKEIEDALAKAELLRQSILKKAFSGQLIK